MRELNTSQNLNKKRKCRCCSLCCIFPSYCGGDQTTEQVVDIYENEDANQHFKEDLPRPLDPGTIIKVKGKILPECSRFAVNLCCNNGDSNDIALHLNPRISQRYVVRNTRIKNHWGAEELTSVSKFELIRNQQFQIDIVITETKFLININGRYVCAFAYRIPITNVTSISVEGPINLTGIECDKISIYPQLDQAVGVVADISEDSGDFNCQQNFIVPLTLLLKDGFQEGWQLEIQGRVKVYPTDFFVNLQDGPQLWPSPNIYLHLNPRFGYAKTRHVFVRNAWLDGCWGPEERVECFLFAPGLSFSLAIRKCDRHFSVYIDGQLAGEFTFRGDVNKINALYIQGDVNIKSIGMRRNVNDKYFHKSIPNVTLHDSKQSLVSSN